MISRSKEEFSVGGLEFGGESRALRIMREVFSVLFRSQMKCATTATIGITHILVTTLTNTPLLALLLYSPFASLQLEAPYSAGTEFIFPHRAHTESTVLGFPPCIQKS
jgi:hypothetical protein